jgi:hypothetical protein
VFSRPFFCAPTKDGICGKRVFIDEYGFPADRYTPKEQPILVGRVMRIGLEWGCPFVLILGNAQQRGQGIAASVDFG